MQWKMSHRADVRAVALANRHYSRQKPDSAQFVPPGRCIVLLTRQENGLWVSSWPYAQYTRHAWAGAWICSLFRNESSFISSQLIRDAVAVTKHLWGPAPVLGMVTFVDSAKVRKKRDYGRCYRRAGWTPCGYTQRGLIALRIAPDTMPPAQPPLGALFALPE